MKIGVISDTHDQYENILKAVKILNQEKVSSVIHCGDWVSPFTQLFYKNLKSPLRGIFGNNDGDRKYHLIYAKKSKIEFMGEKAELEMNKRNIFIYHGTDQKLIKFAIKSGKYNAIFHGHTHIAENKLIGNTLVLNPGTFMPVTDNKIKGASLAIYETQTNTAKIIKI